MVLYLVASPVLSRSLSQLLFLLGLVCVVIVFFETIAQDRRPTPHLFVNVGLILGFFFITTSVTELTGKGLFGVLTVLLCAVWLNARVTLSTWRHRRTCDTCTASCKMYTNVPNASR